MPGKNKVQPPKAPKTAHIRVLHPFRFGGKRLAPGTVHEFSILFAASMVAANKAVYVEVAPAPPPVKHDASRRASTRFGPGGQPPAPAKQDTTAPSASKTAEA